MKSFTAMGHGDGGVVLRQKSYQTEPPSPCLMEVMPASAIIAVAALLIYFMSWADGGS